MLVVLPWRFWIIGWIAPGRFERKEKFILFFKIALGKRNWKKKFFPPNSSDDLYLFFCLYPSSTVCSNRRSLTTSRFWRMTWGKTRGASWAAGRISRSSGCRSSSPLWTGSPANCSRWSTHVPPRRTPPCSTTCRKPRAGPAPHRQRVGQNEDDQYHYLGDYKASSKYR